MPSGCGDGNESLMCFITWTWGYCSFGWLVPTVSFPLELGQSFKLLTAACGSQTVSVDHWGLGASGTFVVTCFCYVSLGAVVLNVTTHENHLGSLGPAWCPGPTHSDSGSVGLRYRLDSWVFRLQVILLWRLGSSTEETVGSESSRSVGKLCFGS